MSNRVYDSLPPGLPAPVPDGAADHLTGMLLPDILLPSTSNRGVCLSELTAERTILYAYPKTGVPGQALPEDWDMIPGARGCTPQACSFRDHHRELRAHGAEVFGISTQTSAYQIEAKERLHLPFDLLSDDRLMLATALRLPTFEAGGERLLKRITLVIRGGKVEHVFYPVFPPDDSASQTLRWLAENAVG
jgi:peroxiredoxin